MDEIEKGQESFDQEFCEFLEWHLCATFKQSKEERLRGFWCDGVVWRPISKDVVKTNKEFWTIAFIGTSGQDEFRMKIKLGKRALEKFLQGTVLSDCVPDSSSMSWIDIDLCNKQIEIQLQ